MKGFKAVYSADATLAGMELHHVLKTTPNPVVYLLIIAYHQSAPLILGHNSKSVVEPTLDRHPNNAYFVLLIKNLPPLPQ